MKSQFIRQPGKSSMKIRHIRSLDLWLLSKGNRVLYRGKDNPWHSPRVIAAALRREGKIVPVAA